jgi:hypothetical protein
MAPTLEGLEEVVASVRDSLAEFGISARVLGVSAQIDGLRRVLPGGHFAAGHHDQLDASVRVLALSGLLFKNPAGDGEGAVVGWTRRFTTRPIRLSLDRYPAVAVVAGDLQSRLELLQQLASSRDRAVVLTAGAQPWHCPDALTLDWGSPPALAGVLNPFELGYDAVGFAQLMRPLMGSLAPGAYAALLTALGQVQLADPHASLADVLTYLESAAATGSPEAREAAAYLMPLQFVDGAQLFWPRATDSGGLFTRATIIHMIPPLVPAPHVLRHSLSPEGVRDWLASRIVDLAIQQATQMEGRASSLVVAAELAASQIERAVARARGQGVAIAWSNEHFETLNLADRIIVGCTLEDNVARDSSLRRGKWAYLGHTLPRLRERTVVIADKAGTLTVDTSTVDGRRPPGTARHSRARRFDASALGTIQEAYPPLTLGQIEGALRVFAGSALLAYVMGLVITNVYLVRFGATNFDLVRPRFIYTGAVFLMFLAVGALAPAFVQSLARSHLRYRLETPNATSTPVLAVALLIPPALYLAAPATLGDVDRSNAAAWGAWTLAMYGMAYACGRVSRRTFYTFRVPESRRGPIPAWILGGAGSVIAIGLVASCLALFSNRFLATIPQQFGGARPIDVQFIVKSTQVPALTTLGFRIAGRNRLVSTTTTAALILEGPDYYLVRVSQRTVRFNKALVQGIRSPPARTPALDPHRCGTPPPRAHATVLGPADRGC